MRQTYIERSFDEACPGTSELFNEVFVAMTMNDGQRQTVPENSLQGRMSSVPAVNVIANVDTREKPQVVTGGSEGGGCYIVCVCVSVFPCVFVAYLVCRVDEFNVVMVHGDMDRDCVIASFASSPVIHFIISKVFSTDQGI